MFESDWAVLGVKLVIILVSVPTLTLVAGYAEHKVMAHLQQRLGPMYPGGFHGWATLLADGLKFVYKEDIIPKAADKPVFSLAPIAVFVPTVLIFLVIPMDSGLVVEELDLGLFYLLAVSSISTIGVLMAGWASANKYALIGAFRAAGQLIAYELPIVLSAAVVAMLAGTLSLNGIVEAQEWPFALWPPGIGLAAFIVFVSAGVAELVRPPFDMPIAESEIIAGAFTEYSGMRYIFSTFFPEVANMVAISAIGATLFLGGFNPIVPLDFLDVIPGWIWFVGKTSFMVFLLLWIRPTFPRLREDQLQRFSWVVLIPVSLALILAAGAWILYAPEGLKP